MIQDIAPHRFYNEYEHRKPRLTDVFLYFEGNQVLVKQKESGMAPLLFADVLQEELRRKLMQAPEYLFRVDDTCFFTVKDDAGLLARSREAGVFVPGTGPADLSVFRDMQPQYMGFAGITASQIYRFRKSRTFCGACGHPMEYSRTERAMCCPSCGQVEYPKISPAVTVAVINGDRLLMAKSAAGSFRRFALIAGYVEIGESFEETVHREVMEEVGLKVKNVTYYKSQPWAFSDTEMIGFFAQLDGDDTVTLQESELSDARWFTREEIGEYPPLSLTYEMVNLFKAGKNPPFPCNKQK